MIDFQKLKVGFKVLNRDMDSMAKIDKILDDFYYYRWIGIKGRNIYPSTTCKVSSKEIKKYCNSWHELTPLLEELL